MDERIKKFVKHWGICFIALILIQFSVFLTSSNPKQEELFNDNVFVQGSLIILFTLSLFLSFAFNAIKNGVLFSKTLLVITKKEAGSFLFYINVIIFLSGSIIMGGEFIFLLIAMST